MSRWEPAERTPERQLLLGYARRALRAHPDIEVVRFVIPVPLKSRALELGTAAAPKIEMPVCSITRTRFILGCDPSDYRISYRIYNARNGETFYVSEQGDLFVRLEGGDE